MNKRVSIIVPTYNGADKLERLFDALSKQDHRDFELIVAVDGSGDHTMELLDRNRNRFSQFIIIESENVGRAGIRNKGAAKASGDLLLFLDDDIRPSFDLVSRHLSHHKKINNSLLSGNAVEDPALIRTEFQRFKYTLSQHWLIPFSDGEVLMNNESFFLTAANFSVEAMVFEALGGFNQELRDAEDLEFGMRAFLAGYPVYFNKDIHAWHEESLTFRKFIRRQRQYRQANMQLLRMHPSWADTFPQLRSGEINKWKKAFASPFRLKGWVGCLDKNCALIKILPWRLRYALFQRVVAAWSFYFPEKEL